MSVLEELVAGSRTWYPDRAILRIAVADYSGHPFQVQLSRELASRGHEVRHFHFAEFQTPKGRLDVTSDDPETFSVDAISLGRPFPKHDFFKRRREEIELGRRFRRRIESFAPDVVLGSNLPLDTLTEVISGCRDSGRAFVFWQQDIYSVAIDRILKAKFGIAGRVVGRHYRLLEKRALEASDAVVVISDDFPSALAREFGAISPPIEVIPNWAPLDEITPRPKDNPWSRRHGIAGRPVVVYSGTLGMKHDPSCLLSLAKALQADGDALLIVTSTGPAADWLAKEGSSLASLKVLPFQSYEDYPDVLGSADVLVSILETDAGIYSVPSKVLSYLCAARAIVISAPEENLASRIVDVSGAGCAVGADHTAGFVDATLSLLRSPERLSSCAANARRYAEANFDITGIANRFSGILRGAVLKAVQKSAAPLGRNASLEDRVDALQSMPGVAR